ncbi:MAG: response regulator [Myxococcota bacterium]|nr:response regulator [Myxococcota bacterium]
MSIGALIEKFRSVGFDRIERMNVSLVALERDPADAHASEEILREIHTLKGEAKMMGFADVNLVAHQTENLLMKSAELGWKMQEQTVDTIFQGFDLIRALLSKQAGSNDTPVDLSQFVDNVHARMNALEASSGKEPPSSPHEDIAQPFEKEGNPEPKKEEPEQLEEGHPPAPAKRASTLEETSASRQTSTRATFTTTSGPMAPVQDESEGRRQRQTTGSGMLRIQAENTLRVRFDKLERLGDVASEVLLMSRRLEYQMGMFEDFREQLRDWLKMTEPNLPKSHFAAMREMIHRFDAISGAASENNHLVNVRATQLDEEVRTLRHISLAQVISHYPRAVRDLAQTQGKRVRFVHDVGNIEVDRAVLSALSDPLLHLVRNSVDHGVESPHERVAAGKKEEAEVYLEAEHIGDSLKVTLRDDGKGIDPEHLKKRAVEKQVITAREAALLEDQQALALIFEPGFSTREDVTDISGRGIGMDIVLRQITNMGGVVEVESEVGEGTTFTLLIPLSSAVSEVLLVALGEKCFGVQAKDVERIARVTNRRQLVHIHGGVCVRYEGRLIPLLDWRPLLTNKGGELDSKDELTLLIVRKGARHFATWVDEVIGEREAISRPLGDFLKGVRLCRGVAMTDAGEVIPLLNVVELIARSRSQAKSASAPSERGTWSTLQMSQLPQTRTILVAEDSEVTRTLVTGILSNLGYRIIQAEDGQQAWEMLQNYRVDLLMTDIQMPRMSGLELLESVRADPALEDIPVIMLSTLGSAADKEYAMRLGADAYLVKLDFREKELVSTVRRYLKR